MVIGLLCSAAHGVALPLMCVVFGKMTDSFVSSGQGFNLTGIFNRTIKKHPCKCMREFLWLKHKPLSNISLLKSVI